MTTESKKPASHTRMSRSQIREGLDQFPIGVLLAGTGKKDRLTHKQKAFAHALATGEMTQADAYRKAYKGGGKAKTIGDNASRLAKHSGVQAETIAIQAAMEAMKYQNAGQLKALVVHQLTCHALDESNPPAQRIKALELLGKTHDVGLFVERREITTITSSMDIKTRLLDQLKTFIRSDVQDVEDTGASSLLAELASANPLDAVEKTPTAALDALGDPVPPAPPDVDGFAVSQDTHTIPLTRSPSKSAKENNNDLQPIDFIEEKVVTPNVWSEKNGAGGIDFPSAEEEMPTETPPLDEFGSPVDGDIIQNGFRVKK